MKKKKKSSRQLMANRMGKGRNKPAAAWVRQGNLKIPVNRTAKRHALAKRTAISGLSRVQAVKEKRKKAIVLARRRATKQQRKQRATNMRSAWY